MFFTLKWLMSCLWKIMFDQIITTQHDKFHIVPWTPHALLQGSKMGQTCHRQCWSSSKLPSLSSCSHSPSQSSKPTGNSEAASHRYLRLKDNWLQIIDQHDSSSLLARSSCPTRLDTDSLNLDPQAKRLTRKKPPWGDRGAASLWKML